MSFTFHFEQTDGGWRPLTSEYIYWVHPQDVDQADARYGLFSWHWHRALREDPHLHVSISGDDGGVAAPAKLHVPTGIVPLEAVIRLLIEDMDVVPERDDWPEVLTNSLKVFAPDPKRWWLSPKTDL